MNISKGNGTTNAGSELSHPTDHPTSMADAAAQAFRSKDEPASRDPGASGDLNVSRTPDQGGPTERLPATQSQPDAGASL